jgi:hypothetical protein
MAGRHRQQARRLWSPELAGRNLPHGYDKREGRIRFIFADWAS